MGRRIIWHRVWFALAILLANLAGSFNGTLADSIIWLPDASGIWSNPANWSPHSPGINDDVTINVASSITVTHDAGTTSIFSLGLLEKLIVNGSSSLTVGNATTGGDLLIGDGQTLQVDAGAQFNYAGVPGGGIATIDGANILANTGGTIDLSQATSYVQTTGGIFNPTRTIRADGIGSQIDLSGLTNFDAKNESFTKMQVFALNGGEIDMSSLSVFDTGAVNFKADGTGSFVNLTGLTSFQAQAPFSAQASLVANNGGTVLADNLVDANQVNIVADGSGSFVDVRSLTTFTSGSGGFQIKAANGGTVQADNLVDTSKVNIVADGIGSVVDVSSLTTFAPGSTGSQIKAINSGVVMTDSLTTVDRGAIVLDGTGVISTSQIETFTRSKLTISGGASPDMSGLTNIDASDFVVSGGSTLVVPATSWADPGAPSFSERVFVARDANSVLDLSTITSLTPSSGSFSNLSVKAEDGGLVDLSGFDTYGGNVLKVLADGSGSQIDFSGLQQIVGSENFTSISQFKVASGGHINMPNLTSIDRVDLVFNSSGTMDTDQIASFTHATITADGAGVSPSFSGIVTSAPEDKGIDGVSLIAKNGAQILIPNATRYRDFSNNFFFADRTFEANGFNSLVDLSGMQELQSGTGAFAELRINALAGGEVDLSGLNSPSANSGVLKFKADGPLSVIDLSGLTTFTPAQERFAVVNSFEVSNGGRIIAPNLTSLEYVNITTDGVDAPDGSPGIDTAQLTDFLRGTFTVTGGNSPDLSGLQTIDGASFIVQHGKVLDVSNAVNYDDTVSEAFADRLLRADGPGSVLDLSGLTQLKHTNAAFSVLNIQALDGGEVNLGGITTFNSGAAQILADGNGSLVDLSSMTVFAPQEVFGERSGITATNNGVVKLGAAPPPLPNVDINVSNGGMIMVDDYTLSGGATISGDGSWGGSLTVADGTLSPGNSPGIFQVATNYQQTAAGTLTLEFGGTAQGEIDALDVGGAVNLAGSLSTSMINGYTPVQGHSFQIISADAGVSGQFATITGASLGGDLGLAVTYEPNQVLATVATQGDADLDGDIDTQDIGAAIGGFTGAGGTGGHWALADFDGDGDIDTQDTGHAIGNFTGAQQSQATFALALDPNRADLIYDPVTGNVQLDAAEAAGGIITNFGFGNAINGFNAPGVGMFPDGGGFTLVDDKDFQIGWSDPSGIGFSGVHDLGNIFPTGLSHDGLNDFLTLANYVGQQGSGTFDLDVTVVPEPDAWALLALGVVALGAFGWRIRKVKRT